MTTQKQIIGIKKWGKEMKELSEKILKMGTDMANVNKQFIPNVHKGLMDDIRPSYRLSKLDHTRKAVEDTSSNTKSMVELLKAESEQNNKRSQIIIGVGVGTLIVSILTLLLALNITVDSWKGMWQSVSVSEEIELLSLPDGVEPSFPTMSGVIDEDFSYPREIGSST